MTLKRELLVKASKERAYNLMYEPDRPWLGPDYSYTELSPGERQIQVIGVTVLERVLGGKPGDYLRIVWERLSLSLELEAHFIQKNKSTLIEMETDISGLGPFNRMGLQKAEPYIEEYLSRYKQVAEGGVNE